jgi:hypothetical protein
VLLTVQVDSISIYHNDRVIPANVARAANFYQPTGFSTASPRFALPIRLAPASSEIFGPTTQRALTTANNIPGMTVSSRRPTPRLNAMQMSGNVRRL